MQRTLAMLFTAWLAAAAAHAQFFDGPGEVPYVPTPYEVVNAMLKLGGANSNDIIYDLGCGDGRIVVTAIQNYHAKGGVGIDIDPERIKDANETARKAGVEDKVKFIEQDLFNADLREASLVTLYLLPDVNRRLRPKLWKELKVGSRVVSHSFDMGDWKPDQKIEVNGRTLYLWKITPEHKTASADK